MASVFKKIIKDRRQIKTKDQNLKKKHFIQAPNKANLLELSLQKIESFVESGKKLLEKRGY